MRNPPAFIFFVVALVAVVIFTALFLMIAEMVGSHAQKAKNKRLKVLKEKMEETSSGDTPVQTLDQRLPAGPPPPEYEPT